MLRLNAEIWNSALSLMNNLDQMQIVNTLQEANKTLKFNQMKVGRQPEVFNETLREVMNELREELQQGLESGEAEYIESFDSFANALFNY